MPLFKNINYIKKKRAQLASKCTQPIRTNTYQTVNNQNILLREEENFQRNERCKLQHMKTLKKRESPSIQG